MCRARRPRPGEAGHDVRPDFPRHLGQRSVGGTQPSRPPRRGRWQAHSGGCGEGTQRQLLRSGAGFRRLDRLLLTHGHFDHVLGIPGLFSTLGSQQSAETMTIHGGAGTLDAVVRMLAGLWGEGRAPIPVELVPLSEGQVIDTGDFAITCFPVRHRDTDSFGFSFESAVRRHLQPARLAALGVPDGPVRRALAEGSWSPLKTTGPLALKTFSGLPRAAESWSSWAIPKPQMA
jgi:ribonuclease BN (tRNA processing enzyme)